MEVATKYFVQEKTRRMSEDKLKVPTTKILSMSSKKEKANSYNHFTCGIAFH